MKAILLILAGSLLWSLTMVKSGLLYSFGMGFWGPNGHDGVWHIALITHLAKGSFDMPVFAGESLKNYHVGFDLFLAIIQRVTSIPAHNLYFQVLPILLATGIGFLTYKFVFLWRSSKTQAFWSTFFVYFGGSFGFIVTLVKEGKIGGESLFWSQQAISTLINPPFAASIFVLLAAMIFLLKYEEKRSLKFFLGSAIAFGLLTQIKVYAGILALLGLLLFSLFKLLKNKDLSFLGIFIVSVSLSALLFFPLNREASSLVVFQPFWFLETMMALSDRFGWPKFYEAMTNYRLGNVWVKASLAYGFAFLLFLIGNMGTRIIAFLGIAKDLKEKRFDGMTVFLSTIFLLGVFFPMFFLQKGTPWNTIQFFYYSLFVSSIFAGIAVDNLKLAKNKILIFVLLLAMIPSTIGTLPHYLPERPPAKLSNEEMEALNFLKKQPDGIVLTYPFDQGAADLAVVNPPRPLYLYESTAYVAAFSEKPTYLEDEVNLNITGYDWRTRRKAVENFLNSLDLLEVRSFLKDNNIEYIYWIGKQRARLGESQLGIVKIFENKEVNIYQVE